LDYLKKSGSQVLLGNYTDDVTLLGTLGQIALGFTPLDWAADARDISSDLVNWEWSWGHAGQTLIDLVGLIPVVGSLKYTDEVLALVKEAAKHSDEAGEVAKALLKNADGIGGTAKDAENLSEAAQDVLRNTDELTKGVGNYSDLAEKARNVDVSTSAHQAVFYSGEGNRAQAEAFAQLNGKTTLEMTPGGKYFDDLKLFEAGSPLTKAQARDIWKILSERYAKGASGNVYGFVNGANPGSIFNTVEYLALQKNPYITNIFTEFLK
jgi:hypothetical protein